MPAETLERPDRAIGTDQCDLRLLQPVLQRNDITIEVKQTASAAPVPPRYGMPSRPATHGSAFR